MFILWYTLLLFSCWERSYMHGSEIARYMVYPKTITCIKLDQVSNTIFAVLTEKYTPTNIKSFQEIPTAG